VIALATAVVAAGGGGAAIAVAAGSPSPAQIRAQKARLAAAHAKAAEAAREAEIAKLLAGVSITPVSGASGVLPTTPVTVVSSYGVLSSVEVSGDQSDVAGVLTPDHTKWTSSSALAPGTVYSVTATVTGPGGVLARQVASFTTMKATQTVSLTLFPYGGMTVGVGEPVIVHFNHAITTNTAQQAVLSHFTITESNPVPGGWHWFSPYELHFRPEAYWPTGEQVRVTSNLNGWDAGAGRWGTGQVTAGFVVGDSHISVANLQAERMTVYLNGTAIATYAISGGRPQYPTMGGTHIVMDKEHVVHMVSSTVGIPVNSPDGYDEYVYNDVHISDSGEYVHDAPWSVGSQGHTNVSHGCVNLSPTDSLSFFNFSQVGDVVQVVGSPRPPASGDHGVMDWTTDWSLWTPGTVTPAPGAPPVSTTTTPSTTSTASAPAAY
jgi:lipoprotein-anchoring transpeptidase ErfK/SrfK